MHRLPETWMLSFWKTAKMLGTVASLDYKEQTLTVLTYSEQNALWPNTANFLQNQRPEKQWSEPWQSSIHLWEAEQVAFGDWSISWECSDLKASRVWLLCLVLANFNKRRPELSHCRARLSPTLLTASFPGLIIVFYTATYKTFSLPSKATCGLTSYLALWISVAKSVIWWRN